MVFNYYCWNKTLPEKKIDGNIIKLDVGSKNK